MIARSTPVILLSVIVTSQQTTDITVVITMLVRQEMSVKAQNVLVRRSSAMTAIPVRLTAAIKKRDACSFLLQMHPVMTMTNARQTRFVSNLCVKRNPSFAMTTIRVQKTVVTKQRESVCSKRTTIRISAMTAIHVRRQTFVLRVNAKVLSMHAMTAMHVQWTPAIQKTGSAVIQQNQIVHKQNSSSHARGFFYAMARLTNIKKIVINKGTISCALFSEQGVLRANTEVS